MSSQAYPVVKVKLKKRPPQYSDHVKLGKVTRSFQNSTKCIAYVSLSADNLLCLLSHRYDGITIYGYKNGINTDHIACIINNMV